MNRDRRPSTGARTPPKDSGVCWKKVGKWEWCQELNAQGGGSPEKTEEHAKGVRAVMKGQDVVENSSNRRGEHTPPAFDGGKMKAVGSWKNGRPLEPVKPATALVPYPRNWNAKRGRYYKFKAPGAGVYGILRARPTF